jgi:hypothetical protein
MSRSPEKVRHLASSIGTSFENKPNLSLPGRPDEPIDGTSGCLLSGADSTLGRPHRHNEPAFTPNTLMKPTSGLADTDRAQRRAQVSAHRVKASRARTARCALG